MAAGDKKYGNDDEPNDVVVVKKVAKAVVHKEFLQKFLRVFRLSVSIICRSEVFVTVFCRNS